MHLLNILLVTISVILSVPALFLFAEIILALGYRPEAPQSKGKRPNFAILMPAHDEAVGICKTLENLLPQLLPTDRLVVIADNCSDNTAGLAVARGAEVIERHDSVRRGKGFALDFGVRHLESAPPEVVIIADADCFFSAGSVDRLARECQRLGQPIQALYLMQAPDGARPGTQIAQFAWAVKNQVRPTGMLALDLPCHLMGTGMAFPWECIRSAQLATGNLVEDMQLGLDLARQGEAPRFCPEALVTSSFPLSEDGARSQRTRWEHGHLGVILREAPHLLVDGLLSFDIGIVALALDLMVPPLALFMMLVTFGTMIDAVFVIISGNLAAFVIASVTLIIVGISILLAWLRYGRHIVSLSALVSAPTYALRKVPIYLRFLVSRQLEWVRSKRDP